MTGECILDEVSSASDDLADKFFVNEDIERFSEMEEAEPAKVKLVNDVNQQ